MSTCTTLQVPTCFQNCQPVPGPGNQLYFFHICERKTGKPYCARDENVPQSTLGIITRTSIPWKKVSGDLKVYLCSCSVLCKVLHLQVKQISFSCRQALLYY